MDLTNQANDQFGANRCRRKTRIRAHYFGRRFHDGDAYWLCDALCSPFQANVKCINLARGGRSCASFRAEGLWDNVMTLLRDPLGNPASPGKTYVLIRSGHNDQPGKPGRFNDLATELQ